MSSCRDPNNLHARAAPHQRAGRAQSYIRHMDRDNEATYIPDTEAPPMTGSRCPRTGWRGIDLDAALPELNFAAQGRSTTTSRDAAGNVHLLISTQAQGAGEGWYHPANEVHHMTFTPDGRVDGHQQLTIDDPTQARWLPSIEHWNWGATATSCADGHWYTWTSGINAGWMDAAGYEDTLKTQVWLGRR